MCGIAGWLDNGANLQEKEETMDKLLRTMGRRGPDDTGKYVQKNVCLLHSRLVVVDPEMGRQPMSMRAPGIDSTIVYNGELYNTEQVRDELKELGYDFNGHSDTEVVLKAFVHWGEDCVEKFNGIFAFAVWDNKAKKLFIARDRIGVKPLFFVKYPGGLIFASEIKTLIASGRVDLRLDDDMLKEIFMIGPGRTSGQGLFKNVKELCPGECAVFSAKGFKVRKYWTLKAREFTDDAATAVEKVRELLIDAVTKQLVSDMPLCCFLSGGLDSSCICKIASDYFRKHGKGPLTTYSVDYVDNSKYFKKNAFQPNSDNEYIAMMMKYIGSDHHQVVISNETLAKALTYAVEARDVPAMADIDSSLLLFCREVKKNFTVALSGECSDEIFGGYPWYHDKDILYDDTFPWSRTLELRKTLLKDGVIKNADEYVYDRYESTIASVDKLDTDTKEEARMREMFALNFNWFMQTLLDRKDRMSMYSGLEVRVPFCDYRIVEYAYNMPWKIKSLNGREKGILREAMRGFLPDEIVFRKKSPYPKTFNPVYMRLVSESVMKILDDKSSYVGSILNRDMVMRLIQNPEEVTLPWYGQLMRAPQVLAYIIQIDYWFNHYNILF